VITLSNAFRAKVDTLLTDTDALLDGAEIGLFEGAPELTAATVLGDLTPASYNGYATVAGVFTPQVDADGNLILMSLSATFRVGTSAGLPIQVTGVYVIDDDGDLVCAGYLPTPITLVAAAQQLHTVGKVPIMPQQLASFHGTLE